MSAINITFEVERLLQYALQSGLIEIEDTVCSRNLLSDLLNIDSPYEGFIPYENLSQPTDILTCILDYAAENNMLENNSDTYRDLLDAKIMGLLMPRSSEIANTFRSIYFNKGPHYATDWYYNISQKSNYIRVDRVSKNMHWSTETIFENIEMTINLSKPEKDPKAIAAEITKKQDKYPKCFLCRENVGYQGRTDHPARQNHRVIPLRINGENWSLQYSPYSYYNEHCIIFSNRHKPMKIDENSFRKMLDFVDQFPQYFIGSNADLPIVGGSILSHDHFQGGKHDFPMAKTIIEKHFKHKEYPDVNIGILKWPMSVIRLNSKNSQSIIKIATKILDAWKNYSDKNVDIIANSNNTPHNTVTPIARKNSDEFEVDVVLRNNRVSKEHPFGIFHPHANLHHIKKENIGLIEVMGLAVLPGRLKNVIIEISKILIGDIKFNKITIQNNHVLKDHLNWIEKLVDQYGASNTLEHSEQYIKNSISLIFLEVLEDAGVYKRDKIGKLAFVKFLTSVGFE